MSWNVEADGYFVSMPEWLDEAGVSDKAFRLYFRLSSEATQRRGKLPGRQEIAKIMGWSERTTDRAMKELEDVGALGVKRQYDATTKRYLPSMYQVRTARPKPSDLATKSDGREPVANPVDWKPVAKSDDRESEKPVAKSGDASSIENYPSKNAEDSAPSSPPPRSVDSPRALNEPADSGLTPGSSTPPSPPSACPIIDRNTAMAREIADYVSANRHPAPKANVREQAVLYADFLALGWTREQVQAAAMAVRVVHVTFLENELNRQKEAAVPPRRDGKPHRPPPPLVRVENEPRYRPAPRNGALR